MSAWQAFVLDHTGARVVGVYPRRPAAERAAKAAAAGAGWGVRPLAERGRIDLRATPDQRERWSAAAARAGLSLSEWIRSTLDGAAPERRPEV